MKAGTETVDFKSRPRYDIAVKTIRVFTIRAMAAMIEDMRRNLGFGHKYEERDLDDWRVMGMDRGARFMAIRVDTFNGEIFVKFMNWMHELPGDGGDSYAPGANLNDCDKTVGIVELDPGDLVLRRPAPKRSNGVGAAIESIKGWCKSLCIRKAGALSASRGHVADFNDGEMSENFLATFEFRLIARR